MTQTEIFYAIKNCSRQENNAIELLFKLFYPKVKSIVLRHYLCEDDAKCIMQDCIIDLVFKIKSGKFEILLDNSCQRYILKSAKNRSMSLSRKAFKTVYNLPYDLTSEVEDTPTLNQDKLIEKIFEISSKSKNGKEIITRRFMDNQDYGTIEKLMNYSKNSAKNGLYRIFLSIRKELKIDDYIVK